MAGPVSSRRTTRYTAWEVILTNIPSILTFTLGFIIMLHLGILFGILYLAFSVVAILLFMKHVCTYCLLYNSGHCRSGYGRVAPKLFKRNDPTQFYRMFKRFIPFFSLMWIFPLLGSVVLLLRRLTPYHLTLALSFVVIGFLILPLFHRYYECKNCPNRKNCPWGR